MRPKIYGLTGGIGVGKSVVARMFEAAGVPVINADEISREIMKPGASAFNEIVDIFGKGVVKDGELDRNRLRKIVFGNNDLRNRLEKITHKRILENAFEKAKEFYKNGKRVVLLEAAVLIEAKFDNEVDGIIVVTATHSQQRERSMKRDEVKMSDIESIIKAQLSDEERLKHAQYVIDNSGTLAETERQVKELAYKLSSSK